MSYLGWENNPNGICEDAPCCGCCGPQGDGVIYDEPNDDPDQFYELYDEFEDEPESGRSEGGGEFWPQRK